MLSKKIGIDMGTSRMVVYVKGEGVVLDEPALIATDEKRVRVLAVGGAAQDLLRRAGPSVQSMRAVQNGAIVDSRAAALMLQHFVARVCGRQRIFRPDVMLAVPSAVTGVERRTLLEAAIAAGARAAYLIEKPLAAAIGSNLPVATTRGLALCNIGGGTTEAAVISMGEIVAQESISVGGAKLDASIAALLQQRHGVTIDEQQAERLKVGIGSAIPPSDATSMEVGGVDGSGQPAAVRVSDADVCEAIAEPLSAIVGAITRVLEQTPPEFRADVWAHDLVLTGGGAQLRGLASFVASRVDLPVRVASQPQACVAIGAGMALDNLQVLKGGHHYIT